jgi:hypothetical protein
VQLYPSGARASLNQVHGGYIPVIFRFGSYIPVHGSDIPVHGSYIPVHGGYIRVHGG